MTTVQQEMFQQSTEELISGSEAIAIACALADVDVITAYPHPPLRHGDAVRVEAEGRRRVRLRLHRR